MPSKTEIAALRLRIEKAERDRDALHASGGRENYLEACSMLEALEVQLARLMRSRY